MSEDGTGVNPPEKSGSPNKMRGFGETDKAYNKRQEANARRKARRQRRLTKRENDANNRKTQRLVEKELNEDDQAQIDKYKEEREENEAREMSRTKRAILGGSGGE